VTCVVLHSDIGRPVALACGIWGGKNVVREGASGGEVIWRGVRDLGRTVNAIDALARGQNEDVGLGVEQLVDTGHTGHPVSQNPSEEIWGGRPDLDHRDAAESTAQGFFGEDFFEGFVVVDSVGDSAEAKGAVPGYEHDCGCGLDATSRRRLVSALCLDTCRRFWSEVDVAID